MTLGGRSKPRPPGRRAAGFVVTGCLALAACSSAPASTATTTTTATRPTTPAHPAVYRFGGVSVKAAFPGQPLRLAHPENFALLLPPGSSSVAWNIGDLGTLAVHSYELVIAAFPPKTPLRIIDDFLSHYGGTPNTTRYGRPALRQLNTVPLSGGVRYSGIAAFSVGTVLVMAVGLDTVAAEVSAFTSSVGLASS